MSINIFFGNKTNKVEFKSNLTVKLIFSGDSKECDQVRAKYSVGGDLVTYYMQKIPSMVYFKRIGFTVYKEDIIQFLKGLLNNETISWEFFGAQEQSIYYDSRTSIYFHYGNLVEETGGHCDSIKIKLDDTSRKSIVESWRKLYHIKKKTIYSS
jgi:hypothetical protein